MPTHPPPATPGRALLADAASLCDSTVPGGAVNASSFTLTFDSTSGCFTISAGAGCDPASGHCCVGASAPKPPKFKFLLITPSSEQPRRCYWVHMRHHAASCVSPDPRACCGGASEHAPPFGAGVPCAFRRPFNPALPLLTAAVSLADSTPCAIQDELQNIK